MKIEIWSDIMCPFCYIGKRHLEQALETFSGRDAVEITWKSYQLDPTIPMSFEEPVGVYEYLADRKGWTLEQSQQMHERVVEMAASVGLEYNFDKAVVANSLYAHRVIQLAKEKGLENHFIQDNQSLSSYGVIRGLHYQKNPYAQVKLVRVLQGRILDVAVDIRKGSPTYGKSFCLELSSENKKQLYIPAGFAHGFSVLSETAEVLYKCDNFYNKQSEGGLLYNDPSLKIDWKIEAGKEIVSGKDLINSAMIDLQEDSFF